MTTTVSVITPERFDRALSYAEYLASIAINRDKFEHYDGTAQFSDDDVTFFKKARRSHRDRRACSSLPRRGARTSSAAFQCSRASPKRPA